MNKVNLNAFLKNNKSQREFVINAALTFRLHIEQIFQIFDCEEIFGVKTIEELYVSLVNYEYNIHNAFIYLFNFDGYDQELAVTNFKKFYSKLLIALRMKNKLYIEYLNEINNTDFLEIINKGSVSYTDEEYFEIVKFQLKYALSIREISRIIDRNHSGYLYRARKILENHPDLLQSYNELIEHNNDAYKHGMKEGRTK